MYVYIVYTLCIVFNPFATIYDVKRSTLMCITRYHVCRHRVDGNNIDFFFPLSILQYVFFGVSVLKRLLK